MSERLEDYVKKHRDDFDILEPNAALWDKIETKLDPGHKRRDLNILWKAAAVILVFGFSFWAQMQLGEKNQTITQHNIHSGTPEIATNIPDTGESPVITPAPENKLIPEFAETEKYYNRKVNSTMKELKVYLVKYPDVATDMKKDLAELDSVYRTLKRDLGDNVAQEEIISAMIQNYRMKLQLLEDIKSELTRNSTPKSTNKNNRNESHVL
jgi:hypothetical protein